MGLKTIHSHWAKLWPILSADLWALYNKSGPEPRRQKLLSHLKWGSKWVTLGSFPHRPIRLNRENGVPKWYYWKMKNNVTPSSIECKATLVSIFLIVQLNFLIFLKCQIPTHNLCSTKHWFEESFWSNLAKYIILVIMYHRNF